MKITIYFETISIGSETGILLFSQEARMQCNEILITLSQNFETCLHEYKLKEIANSLICECDSSSGNAIHGP